MISHHAYYIVGADRARADIVSLLEKKYSVTTRGNPDFFDRVYETFSIDDARELKSLAGTRPVGSLKIFVLKMNGITSEAQNALLKLLEEPPSYAHFFLIIPSAHILLPTVKSRMAMWEEVGDPAGSGKARKEQGVRSREKGEKTPREQELTEMVKKFAASSKPKRLEQVKSLMDEISKDKRPRQDALDFLNTLLEILYGAGVKENVHALRSIELARKYMNDRAPSLKMLLEYVALNV